MSSTMHARSCGAAVAVGVTAACLFAFVPRGFRPASAAGQTPTASATAPATTAPAATGVNEPHTAPLHHGQLSVSGAHSFETVISPDGLRIYLYTPAKTPAMVEGATGIATLTFKDGTTKGVPLVSELPAKEEPAVYFCPMHADVVRMQPGVCEKCGGMTLFTQNRLYGKVDLSQAEAGTVTAMVRLTGLEGKEKMASFTVTNAPSVMQTEASKSGTKTAVRETKAGKVTKGSKTKASGGVRK